MAFQDFGGAVTATGEKSVQHRQIDGPLQIEAFFTLGRKPAHDLLQAKVLPEPPEDQVWSNLDDGNRLDVSRGVGIQDFHLADKTQPAAQQTVELTAVLKDVEPTKGGDDLPSTQTLRDARCGQFASSDSPWLI